MVNPFKVDENTTLAPLLALCLAIGFVAIVIIVTIHSIVTMTTGVQNVGIKQGSTGYYVCSYGVEMCPICLPYVIDKENLTPQVREAIDIAHKQMMESHKCRHAGVVTEMRGGKLVVTAQRQVERALVAPSLDQATIDALLGKQESPDKQGADDFASLIGAKPTAESKESESDAVYLDRDGNETDKDGNKIS